MRTFSAGKGKQLSASGEVTTAGKSGMLLGYAIQHGDTAQSSITFRDGGVSGTIRWVHSKVAQTAAGDSTEVCILPVPIAFSTDIYAVLSGTGTKVCILYVGE